MDVSLARLQEICATFPQQRIVVIGDVMLDHLISGDARRISPEAPIPIVNFVRETYTPGGAANVARNLTALGARADLLGVVGDDASATALRESLSTHGIPASGLVVEPGRPTTVKMRITAQRQQIVRLDRETNRPLSPIAVRQLIEAYRATLAGAAAVIVTDYAKGVAEQSVLDAVLQHARTQHVPVCVDPKPAHPLALRGTTVLTPNRKETFELAGLTDDGATGDPLTDAPLLGAVARIQERHDPDLLLVTLSEAGLLLVERNQAPQHIPTFARQVYDVTGAGDTVIATFVLARAAGASPLEAATIANYAAGIVVGKTGTAAATPVELFSWVGQVSG